MDERLLSRVTYLTPNETEAELLTGVKVRSMEDAQLAAQILLTTGVQNVVITLAHQGALLANASENQHVPGYQVQPVDTVAAGDAFNGALAVGLVSGKTLREAVEFANAVGALTVTKRGAIPSIPFLDEVQKLMVKE